MRCTDGPFVEDTHGTKLLDEDDIFVSFGFFQAAHAHCCLSQHRFIKPTYALLDSESTCFSFYNASLVRNIRPHEGGKTCNVHTNGGTQLSKDVMNYSPLDILVLFNRESLAKIWFLTIV